MNNDVDTTASNGEGSASGSSDFKGWLQSKGAKTSLIDKMLSNDIDSIAVLAEIDLTEINELAKELGLTYAEKAKLKAIAKSVPNKNLNILVDPEERKAILSMETKLNSIQQSLINLDSARTCVLQDVEKCTSLVSEMYDNVLKVLMERKEALFSELKDIGEIKVIKLDDQYDLMKYNSTLISSHIKKCYNLVNKKVDLKAIDQRKQQILEIAKIVNDMQVIDKCDYGNIDFVFEKDAIFDIIKKTGRFNYGPISVPIIVSLECQVDKLNIKWKLDDEYDCKEISQLKVEWCSKMKQDENIDDLKIDWNEMIHQDVENVQNGIKIDLKKCGNYCTVRLQCIVNGKKSKYSKCESIMIKPVPARFIFTHKSNAVIDENGTRIKVANNFNDWTSVTSSTGWNTGKYVWRIKCVERGSNVSGCWSGIGVVVNFEGASKHPQLNALGDALYYYSGGACICTKGGNVIQDSIEQWKSGDIMTIHLDCNLWKIQFILNDKDLGIYDLVPDQTYYPAIQIRGNKGHLKLLQ